MAPADLEQQIAALHPASFAWALACTGWNAAEAEEALQSAYLAILEGRARFDGRSTFKTWLFAVVRNMAARGRRWHWLESRMYRRTSLGTPRTQPQAGPFDAFSSQERGARIRRALGQLASRQREVLDLVFFHELSVEEAASVMGVALGTARAHYHRGKLRLLALLGPEDLP